MKKIIIVALLAIVLVSGCTSKIDGTYDARYINTDLTFQSNLDLAQNISVYPDDQTLKETLFGYQVVGIQFAYYNNREEAPLYMKSLMSFASKYTKMNFDRWNYDISKDISTVLLNSTNDIVNATAENPAIILMGPDFTDKTYIEVQGNVVRVYANDLTLREGKYTTYSDFDLALDKIILVLMSADS